MNAAWLNSQPLNTYGIGDLVSLASAAGLAATATATLPSILAVQAFPPVTAQAAATGDVTVTRRRGYSAAVLASALSPAADVGFSAVRAIRSIANSASSQATLFASASVPMSAEALARAIGDLVPGRIDLQSLPGTAVATSASVAMFARRQLGRSVGAQAVSLHTGGFGISKLLFSSVSAVATQVNTYKVNTRVILSASVSATAVQSLATIWADAIAEAENAFVTATQTSYIGRLRTMGADVGAGVDGPFTSADVFAIVSMGAVAAASASPAPPTVVRASAPMSATSTVAATHASLKVQSARLLAANAAPVATAVASPRYTITASVRSVAVAELAFADATILRRRNLVPGDHAVDAAAPPAPLLRRANTGSIAEAVAEQLAILFTNISNEAPISRTITVLREGDPIVVAKQDTGVVVYGE